MTKFSNTDRSFCIKAFYQNGNSAMFARRAFLTKFNIKNLSDCPSVQLIRSWIKKCEKQGLIEKTPYPPRERPVRNEPTIKAVGKVVKRNPRTSIRRLAAVTGVHRSSIQRILKENMTFHPYKFQLTQALGEKDYERRLRFATLMTTRFPDMNNIIFSDEAHFQLNGEINKQNMRYWSEENPQAIIQATHHPKRCTVWAGLASWGIIGPFFFEDSNGAATTINQTRYQDMLRRYLAKELKKHSGYTSDTWFQQDGATPHTTKASLAVCNEMFPGKVISLRGDIEWPPRSPDLSPLDFFLWGYLKGKVYGDNPKNIDHLKKNIRREIKKIPTAVLRRVIHSFNKRLLECKERNGQHLKDVIFHK